MISELSYYDILGLPQDASPNDIRKAYLRKARECHPDKNPDEDAKLRFQTLQKVYSVLSCPTARALYDKTGEAEDTSLTSRTPISEEDINSFAREYLTSDIEKEDLLENYTKFKGNMKKVFESQILSDEKLDGHRFLKIIQNAIDEGIVKEFKIFIKWSDRVSKTKEIEFSLETRIQRDESDGTLMALINAKARCADFMSHVNELEAKYCPKNVEYEEIDEEEFQKIQSRLISKKDKNHKTSKRQPPKKKSRKV